MTPTEIIAAARNYILGRNLPMLEEDDEYLVFRYQTHYFTVTSPEKVPSIIVMLRNIDDEPDEISYEAAQIVNARMINAKIYYEEDVMHLSSENIIAGESVDISVLMETVLNLLIIGKTQYNDIKLRIHFEKQDSDEQDSDDSDNVDDIMKAPDDFFKNLFNSIESSEDAE